MNAKIQRIRELMKMNIFVETKQKQAIEEKLEIMNDNQLKQIEILLERGLDCQQRMITEVSKNDSNFIMKVNHLLVNQHQGFSRDKEFVDRYKETEALGDLEEAFERVNGDEKQNLILKK